MVDQSKKHLNTVTPVSPVKSLHRITVALFLMFIHSMMLVFYVSYCVLLMYKHTFSEHNQNDILDCKSETHLQ